MKPQKLFSLILVGVIIFGIVACKQEDGPAEKGNDRMVEISFSPEVDGVELEVVPFETKAGSGEKTYYLITIDGSGISKCGLFDSSLDKAKIQLPSGETYYFSMLVVRETEYGHLVPFSGSEWSGTEYEGAFMSPFVTRYPIKPTDGFVENTYGVYLTPSNPVCGDENGSSYNSFVYRYVGYKIEENLQNGGKITIPLKKFYFAVNLNVTRPLDGSLEISIPDFHFTETVAPGEGPVNLFRVVNSRQEATTGWNDLPGMPSGWAPEEFTEDHEIEIKWNRAEGLTSYDVKKTITFAKGMQHNININLNDRAGSIGFDPQFEDSVPLPATSIDID